jgi:hypothetical protein
MNQLMNESINNHGHRQTQVAHAYNPSYSRGRAQEEHSLKPAWANSLQDPISKKKKKITKKGLAE